MEGNITLNSFVDKEGRTFQLRCLLLQAAGWC